jgi:membrane associated rhomboid family serine protease
MLPIGDDDSGPRGFPVINLALIGINAAVFLYQLASPDFTNGFSVVPREITTGTDLVGRFPLPLPDGTTTFIEEARGPSPIWLTILSAMFMHGSWSHIGGNMLFLFIFGDNVERAFGHLRYLGFYLLCGVLATFTQIAVGPNSIIPNLGASGAIAGILASHQRFYDSFRCTT